MSGARETIVELTELCDEISDVFERTHYAALGKRMRRYVQRLKHAFEPTDRPRFDVFVEDQKSLLLALRETQGLIKMSMDQQRPMTRRQVLEYLSISDKKLQHLLESCDFPRSHKILDNQGRRAVSYYRKHEIDHWLFIRPDGSRQGPKPVAPDDIGSASVRDNRMDNCVRLVKK